MDLWDVAKLMGRRWYVALPMLVLTMALALWTVFFVKPDYTATTKVTLLPPTAQHDPSETASQSVNPWTTGSLTVAAISHLDSKRLHDEFEGRGLSPAWTADLDIRFPSLIIIEVTAPDGRTAQATAKELQARVTEEVARQQSRYNVKPGEEITTVAFDDGDNLETATAKVKRALIVVVGVGIILTVGLTISLDAYLRWRCARRQGRPAAGQIDQIAAPVPTTQSVARSQSVVAQAVAGRRNARPNAGSSTPAGAMTEQTVPLAQPITSLVKPEPTSARANDGSADKSRFIPHADSSRNAEPDAAGRADTQAQPARPADQRREADEATVVLPLSNSQWTDGRSTWVAR